MVCVAFQEERFCKRGEEGNVFRGYGQQVRCIFWIRRVGEWA